MENKYPYRFKTEEELIKEFGYKWRHPFSSVPYFTNGMSNLLGQELPYDEKYLLKNNFNIEYKGWFLHKYMLIKIQPNYKPKSKIKRKL